MKEIKEEILIKALELQEEGETLERIYDTFPEAASDLKEIFALADSLKEEAARIEPPSRELLSGALRRAAAGRRIRPAFASLPLAVRILAPALAVALLVFFGSYSPGIAPSSLVQMPQSDKLPVDEGEAGQDAASQEASPALSSAYRETGSAETSAAPASPSAGESFMTMQAPSDAGQEEASAGIATAHDGEAESGPSGLADQVADSYVMSAEAEEATLTEQ